MNQEQDSKQNEVGMTEEDHKDWFFATGLEDAGKEIKIFITRDELSAYLVVNLKQYHEHSSVLTKDQLKDLIEQAKIQYGIKDRELNEFISGIEKAGTFGPFLFAEGNKSRHGKDGYITYYVVDKNEKDSEGRIDYKERDNIISVHKDEKIAKVYPPENGEDGINIYGKTFGGEDGKPVHYRVGQNVRFDELENVYYAECNGRLIIKDTLLSVSQEYIVNRDVDYSIGNIDFLGKVIIHGDIHPDFTIYGQECVEIYGLVENADISSDGDIIIHGGVYCKRRAKVHCKGNFSAKFFSEGYLECEGDVAIEREITASEIKLLGKLDMKKGTVMGSLIMAFGGMEIGSVGSELGVKTTLRAGVHFRLLEQRRDLEEKRSNIDERIRQIENSIKPLLENPQILNTLDEAKKAAFSKITEQIKLLKQEKEDIKKLKEDLSKALTDKTKQEIKVYNKLYQGVSVFIGHYHREFNEARQGPLVLFEDHEEEIIKIRF